MNDIKLEIKRLREDIESCSIVERVPLIQPMGISVKDIYAKHHLLSHVNQIEKLLDQKPKSDQRGSIDKIRGIIRGSNLPAKMVLEHDFNVIDELVDWKDKIDAIDIDLLELILNHYHQTHGVDYTIYHITKDNLADLIEILKESKS